MSRSDGNVIYADFGKRDTVLPELAVTVTMLYVDEFVALARITYRLGDREFIQHVCKGAGINA